VQIPNNKNKVRDTLSQNEDSLAKSKNVKVFL